MTAESKDQRDPTGERKRRLKDAAQLLAIGALRALQGTPPGTDASSDESSARASGEEGKVPIGPVSDDREG